MKEKSYWIEMEDVLINLNNVLMIGFVFPEIWMEFPDDRRRFYFKTKEEAQEQWEKIKQLLSI